MKGEGLFKEYWRRPNATAEAFDQAGWFKTGDTAASHGNPPYWRILGRSSVDIIKSGGYKISALGVENVLLSHPSVKECAVVGVEDEVQGQIVAAVVVPHPDEPQVRASLSIRSCIMIASASLTPISAANPAASYCTIHQRFKDMTSMT